MISAMGTKFKRIRSGGGKVKKKYIFWGGLWSFQKAPILINKYQIN